MKGIISALIIGIGGFFIIIFFQEYETFILPLFKETRQFYSEKDVEESTIVINKYNNLLREAYMHLSPELLKELPAEKSVIEQFLTDIRNYKENNHKFLSVDFTSEVKDVIFLAQDVLQITQRERWSYKIRGRNTDVHDFLIIYTLKKDGINWIVTNMDFSGVYDGKDL